MKKNHKTGIKTSVPVSRDDLKVLVRLLDAIQPSIPLDTTLVRQPEVRDALARMLTRLRDVESTPVVPMLNGLRARTIYEGKLIIPEKKPPTANTPTHLFFDPSDPDDIGTPILAGEAAEAFQSGRFYSPHTGELVQNFQRYLLPMKDHDQET